jgi:D-alanyl-lipoteichoic acid acyltransferase DltB (MBOAT superfamily)
VQANPTNFRLGVVLPVGISFYTFQSLSYTIDIYRRRVAPAYHFWDFALFVAYFPPLVAGPIERARHLLPQLTSPRRIRLGQSMDGIVLILLGLFKKVAIADGVAPAVDSVFNSTGAVSQTDVISAVLLFAIQIFCDFSGYSDIVAIGFLRTVKKPEGTTDLHGGAARKSVVFPNWISTPFRIVVFLFFCCYGWLLFRAHSFAQVKTFSLLLLGFSGAPSVLSKPTTSALVGIIVLIFLQLCDYHSERLESFRYWRPPMQGFLYAALIFILVMGMSNAPVQFIYFQF